MKTSTGGVLLCPACGGENLHQDRVDVYQRPGGEDTQEVHTIASTLGVSVGLDSHDNPSKRRDGLLITFLCESCARTPRLAIWQHKGSTYVEWK